MRERFSDFEVRDPSGIAPSMPIPDLSGTLAEAAKATGEGV